MTRETAIELARKILKNECSVNVQFPSASRRQRGNRNVWLVIFDRIEEEGVITSPE
jgi:hypothetical protein